MYNRCEILNYIYKITVIMIIRIDNANKRIDDTKINKLLNSYKKKYLSIIDDIKKELKRCNENAEKINIVDKIINNYYLINEDKKIIKKYIEVCNTNIKEINKKLVLYNYSERDVSRIINKLVLTIIDNINILRKYI